MSQSNSNSTEPKAEVYKELAHRMHRLVFRAVAGASHGIGRQLMQDCRTLLQDWAKEHAPVDEHPLPDWAESYNEGRKLVLRAQLCTKDGRRMGNARIIDCTDKLGVDPGRTYYRIKTDIGSVFWYTAEEVHEAYWVGNYIMKEGE